ncbi:hypothetical protein M5689_014050 [Euphorbia peplus]|nr:hypothetical protein M5689_014050 [Euphorbia peplus]
MWDQLIFGFMSGPCVLWFLTFFDPAGWLNALLVPLLLAEMIHSITPAALDSDHCCWCLSINGAFSVKTL